MFTKAHVSVDVLIYVLDILYMVHEMVLRRTGQSKQHTHQELETTSWNHNLQLYISLHVQIN